MRAGVPYVYGAVNGWVAQAAVSLPGDRLVETGRVFYFDLLNLEYETIPL